MLSLLLLCHAAAVAVAANNNFAAIGATIVAAVAADATACLRFAAVSTAVRSCCSFMLLCFGMLRLLHFFLLLLLQLSEPRRDHQLPGVFLRRAPDRSSGSEHSSALTLSCTPVVEALRTCTGVDNTQAFARTGDSSVTRRTTCAISSSSDSNKGTFFHETGGWMRTQTCTYAGVHTCTCTHTSCMRMSAISSCSNAEAPLG